MALLEVKYFSHSIAMGCSFKSGAWKLDKLSGVECRVAKFKSWTDFIEGHIYFELSPKDYLI